MASTNPKEMTGTRIKGVCIEYFAPRVISSDVDYDKIHKFDGVEPREEQVDQAIALAGNGWGFDFWGAA